MTVTLETIPDLRTVTFSLIVPIVTVMTRSSGTRIKVLGITATSLTTIAGPLPGPQQLYSAVYLQRDCLVYCVLSYPGQIRTYLKIV